MNRVGRGMITFALLVAVIAGTAMKAAASEEIMVSAAISLKAAFEEIGRVFEVRHPGVKVLFNFGASGDLKAQVQGGAPADVFAAAAVRDMDELEKGGFIVTATRIDFASNRLVLITPAGFRLAVASFADLVRPEIRRIAAGNPGTVPAGRYAGEVFLYYGIADALATKLILAENVRQVLDYVARNEVDAGVVYSTDAAAKGREVKIAARAPENSHRPVLYPIAVVKGARNEKASKAFIDLVTAGEGRKVLSQYGFTPAPAAN